MRHSFFLVPSVWSVLFHKVQTAVISLFLKVEWSLHLATNIAVVENKLSWPDALFYCRNFYWDLLSIRTEEEQRLVQEVLAMASFPLTNEYLNDGTWFWMTGQSVTYSNWKTTLVWQYTKQCGAMETSEGFFWRDLPCDEPLHFICLTDKPHRH
uniref:C-type lectin domain-containing protein n=1 Tax=Mastacembelus armatus TaxID=205130 RepID=A0A7N8X167_9TELE